jgi:outer membrane receptor protein involved in Fe transport
MKKMAGGGLLLVAAAAFAQEDAVVITATRVPQPSLEVPASVDRIYADEIREGRPQVNLSESLGRVPGIVVQNRQNYAQDLQISSRGFGARATFGVRGIRLIADGIPATMPDGQGQASTFALGSAERIEVLRGPFSALYGNAAGGVIVVDTEDPPEKPTIGADVMVGDFGTWRAGVLFGGYNALLDASRFETDGYRDHSAARRDHYNAKLKFGLRPDTSLTIIGNQLRQPDTQDPLGLTRAQFEQNPQQAVPQAFIFNTRKTVYQEQIGATLSHRVSSSSTIQATVYGGSRWVEQYLGFAGSAPPPTTSGGVVQLDRGYGGGALRFSTGEVLRVSLGAEYDRMEERRKGFVNNNGVQGELRRNEDDSVWSTDFYAQAEWRFAERWSAHGGVRASRVEFESTDFFIVPGNPDDSGSRAYSATTPVAGLLYRYSKTVSLYGNLGRGFETPLRRARAPEPAGERPQLRARACAQPARRGGRQGDHPEPGKAQRCAVRHRDRGRDRGRRQHERPHDVQERGAHRAARIRARRGNPDARSVRRAVCLHPPGCDIQGGFHQHGDGQHGHCAGGKHASGRAEEPGVCPAQLPAAEVLYLPGSAIPLPSARRRCKFGVRRRLQRFQPGRGPGAAGPGLADQRVCTTG